MGNMRQEHLVLRRVIITFSCTFFWRYGMV